MQTEKESEEWEKWEHFGESISVEHDQLQLIENIRSLAMIDQPTAEAVVDGLTQHLNEMKENVEQHFVEYMSLQIPSPHFTAVEMTDPRTTNLVTVNIVDFASMTHEEVGAYDGCYGGEEKDRVEVRLKKSPQKLQKSESKSVSPPSPGEQPARIKRRIAKLEKLAVLLLPSLSRLSKLSAVFKKQQYLFVCWEGSA